MPARGVAGAWSVAPSRGVFAERGDSRRRVKYPGQAAWVRWGVARAASVSALWRGVFAARGQPQAHYVGRLGGAGALTQVFQQALGGCFHEIEHFFEAIRAAVVRVGDFGDLGFGGEFQKQAHPFAGVAGGSVV
jgi:hypothetical protein